MIRRNPTLIPMSDNDVQDIRDIANKDKHDLTEEQSLAIKMKRMADNPNFTSEDEKMLESMRKWTEREFAEKNVKPGALSAYSFTFY